jgi:Domain of unknown function (DUF5597)/Glycosyl hydrolases family 35
MLTSRNIRLCFLTLSLALILGRAQGQIPALIEKNGRHTLLVDGKPFLMLGGQAHNSSAWPAMLPQLWLSVENLHANTLEVPIYWEQVEPRQDQFDFSLIDTLLQQARTHNKRLVLLWFATWKNGSNHYMPGWMKHDAGKYPNIVNAKGNPIDSPSPNTSATMEADTKAFKAVMKHLKATDPQHTVIMVQVENESGSWGSVRDYSPHTQKLIDAPVPAELLKPEILKALHANQTTQGSWQQVFGDRADEYFQAWSVASFIGKVAAAGKAEYPLPMYVNAALRDPLTNPMATNYESGGPTDNTLPIWKVAAPAIDLEAPDIYLPESEKVLKVMELYDRPDNALLIPEIGLRPVNAKYFYLLLAHGGIGFSPFGIDDNGHPEADTGLAMHLAPFAAAYATVAPMAGELAQWAFDGKIKAVVEQEDHAAQTIDLGAWKAIVSFGGDGRANAAPNNQQPVGSLMIIQLDENKFLLVGTRCHLTFLPAAGNAGRAWQYDTVEEGKFENGAFKPRRILNGDETDWGGPGFSNQPSVLQTTLTVR